VPAHEGDDALEVFDIDLRWREFRVRDSFADGARAFAVDVGDCNGSHVRRVVREIVSRAEPHATRAEDENFHAVTEIKICRAEVSPRPYPRAS
jgi:hypothetical protein